MRPSASQTISRIQLSGPSENIRPPLIRIPSPPTTRQPCGDPERPVDLGALGPRRIQTAAQTTRKANKVPTLTRSARKLSGTRAATRPTSAHQDRRLPGGQEPGVDRREERPAGAARRAPSPARSAAGSGCHQQRAGDPGQDRRRDQARRPASSRGPGTPRRSARSTSIWLVGDHPGQDRRHGHVEDRADQERRQDADGQVALGVLGLLGVGRDRSRTRCRRKRCAPRPAVTPSPPVVSCGGTAVQFAAIDIGRLPGR